MFSGVRSLMFMRFLVDWLKPIRHLIRTAYRVFLDFLSLLALASRSPLRLTGPTIPPAGWWASWAGGSTGATL